MKEDTKAYWNAEIRIFSGAKTQSSFRSHAWIRHAVYELRLDSKMFWWRKQDDAGGTVAAAERGEDLKDVIYLSLIAC